MKPPFCECCGRTFQPRAEGGLVQFADYEPIDVPGHPKGLLWFCGQHLPTASALKDQSSDAALRQLRAQLNPGGE